MGATANAQTRGEGQSLPPICRQAGVSEAMRTLIRFCPSGNCIPRAGIGDLLEQRVNPEILQRIAAEPLLYPVRIFYRKGLGRFSASDTISSRHYDNAIADLHDLARTYANYRGSKVVVLGRASQTGDAATNIRLSQERARRVADYLERTFNIPPEDVHQAYFGSQLFQLSEQDLEGLGLARNDLERQVGANGSLTELANQSTIAFVFPCPETADPPARAEGRDCDIYPDGGAPHVVESAACHSALGDGDGGLPTDVYIMGGSASETFRQYAQLLGPRYGGRNLRTLTVHYAVARPDASEFEWRVKSGVVGWFAQDLVEPWTQALNGIQAPIAPLPHNVSGSDVFCSTAAAQPHVTSAGNGCSPCAATPASTSGRVRARAALAMFVLALGARRRRKPATHSRA